MFKKIIDKTEPKESDFINLNIDRNYFTKDRIENIVNVLKQGQTKEFILENNKILIKKDSVDYSDEIYTKVFNSLNFEIVYEGSINDNQYMHKFYFNKEVLWMLHFLDINYESIMNDIPIKLYEYQIMLKGKVDNSRFIASKLSESLKERFDDIELTEDMIKILMDYDKRFVKINQEEYEMIKSYDLPISKMKNKPEINFERLGLMVFAYSDYSEITPESNLIEIVKSLTKESNQQKKEPLVSYFNEVFYSIFPSSLKYDLILKEKNNRETYGLNCANVYWDSPRATDVVKQLSELSPIKYDKVVLEELYVKQELMKLSSLFTSNQIVDISNEILSKETEYKWLAWGYADNYEERNRSNRVPPDVSDFIKRVRQRSGLARKRNLRGGYREYSHLEDIYSAIIYEYLLSLI